MSFKESTQETELRITAQGADPITVRGNLGRIHEDPQKIHQLLDLLELPEGTQVKIITQAASVIVR